MSTSQSKDWVQLDEDKIRNIKELQQDLNAVQQRYNDMLDNLVVSQVVMMIFNKLLRLSRKGGASISMCFPNNETVSPKIIELAKSAGLEFEKLQPHAIFSSFDITRYIRICQNPEKPVNMPGLSADNYDAYLIWFSNDIKVVPKLVLRGDALNQIQAILGNTVIPVV